jgi:hypothetical protein
MRFGIAAKFVVVILIGFFVHAPAAYASCVRQGQVGPPYSQPLLYDYSFDDSSCYAWNATGGVSAPGGVGYVVFDSPGYLNQQVTIDTSYSSYAFSFEVSVDGSSPGLEKLRIWIDGVLIDELDGNSPSQRYDYDPIGDYDNSTITIAFQRTYTSFPGDTVFTVNWAEMWGRF